MDVGKILGKLPWRSKISLQGNGMATIPKTILKRSLIIKKSELLISCILDGGWKMWRNLTFFVAFPVIVLAHVNVFMPHADGHKDAVRPDFVPYEYLRIRTKVTPQNTSE